MSIRSVSVCVAVFDIIGRGLMGKSWVFVMSGVVSGRGPVP